MGAITFIDPVATVSGKIAKRYLTVYHVRKAETANQLMIDNPCYTSAPTKRTKPYSDEEQARMQKFAAICKATRVRLSDGTTAQADRLAFQQQSTYKTLYQFVWHQAATELGY